LTLLLPDPTSREINRHISERAKSVITYLETAQHKAPFLNKLKIWPLNIKTGPFLEWEIQKIAKTGFNNFISLFNVKKLGYEKINVDEVMNWYEEKKAPFGDGKKGREFPDAFALAAIKEYAIKNKIDVAIISRDKDFEQACDSYTYLYHYDSLAEYIEAINSVDERTKLIHEVIERDKDKIAKIISEKFPNRTFYVEANWEGDADDIQVENVEIQELHIVGIGNRECTIAFEAEVSYSAYVSYDDLSTAVYISSEDFYMALDVIKGTVMEIAYVTGIVKIKLSSDRNSIYKINILEIDQDSIAVMNEPEEEYYSED